MNVTFDTTGALARVQNMYDDILTMKLETLPAQFEAWQTDDMHRKYPEVTFHPGEQQAIVMTRIWPHSRNQIVRGARRKRLFTIPKNISARQVRGYRVQSHPHTGRPILRPELFEALHQRMRAMLLTLKWRKS